MLTLSHTEENYLKAVYHLSGDTDEFISTNAIAAEVQTAAASVTDMIKRLASKGLLEYKKYRGVKLSDTGKPEALKLIRKHRLWETFLVNKLGFRWDEVHEVAEQLEHIKSPLLVASLDKYLGHPTTDPHGDPIPDKNGRITIPETVPLPRFKANRETTVIGVKQDGAAFLRYLDKIGVNIGCKVRVLDCMEFDGSVEICINGEKDVFLSKEVSENIMVAKE